MRQEYRASPEFTPLECLALVAILGVFWAALAFVIWMIVRALKGG